MAAWEYFTSQKQWEAYLKDLLRNNDKALLSAIVQIYDYQTDDEKSQHISIEENHMGFSKIDAKELSDIALKIKANKPLTKGELYKSRNKMPKYWKQLMYIVKQKAENEKVMKDYMNQERLAQEEIAATNEEIERLERFKEIIEDLRKCSEEGISCSYGICDECPITTGFQLRLNIMMEDNYEQQRITTEDSPQTI